MDLELEGKSALITGGSKGIGLATERAFAAEGVSLHLAARSTGDLESARDDIGRKFGVPVSVHAVDLTQGDTERELAETCSNVDILVNNAGAIPGGTLEDIDEDVWRQAWDLKLFGYINLMRAMYSGMKANGRGVIINVCGTAGNQKPSLYAAAGTRSATRALRCSAGCNTWPAVASRSAQPKPAATYSPAPDCYAAIRQPFTGIATMRSRSAIRALT